MSFEFAIDETVEAAVRAGAIVALNLSGGKDSTMSAHAANAILDKMGHDKTRRLAIHADLGRAEWKSTAPAVKRQAREIGLPLVVTRREAGDMVSRWEQRYEQGWDLYARLKLGRIRSPWSSAGSRFCTAELKRDVLHRYLAATYPGETIISVLGIRHQESPGRAKTPISKIDNKLKRASGTNGILWHPSIHISTDDVYHYHKIHNLHLHEAYTTFGATRLSCAFCVLASRHDIGVSTKVAENHDLFHHLVGIETRTGFSFQQGGWLSNHGEHLLSAAQKLNLASAKAYALERRAIESRITPNFLLTPSGYAWPHRMPDHDELLALVEARRLNASWTGRQLPFVTAASISDRFARMLEHPR